MAERRMFTKKVTDDDNFMALSSSAQALYLHLSMSADDDGFCNQVAISMFKAHASVQDLQTLLDKRYIYQFENGVIVIKHWRMANALRKDRYTPTAFQEELAKLGIKENGAYTWLPDGCQMVAERLPQDRLGKCSVEEDSIGEGIGLPPAPPAPTPKEPERHKHGANGWVLLTDEQYNRLLKDFGPDELERCITYVDESAQITKNKNGWKDWNLVIRKCHREKWGVKTQKQAAQQPKTQRKKTFSELLAEQKAGGMM